MNKFKDLSCNIVFSSELHCYPSENKNYYDLIGYNENDPRCFKYLNSGGFIGYNKNIYEMLQWKNEIEITTLCQIGGDQNYFTKYFLQRGKLENIKLDVDQIIFQSMCSINYQKVFHCKNGKIYNKIFEKIPSILHFNGFGDMVIKEAKHNETNKMLPVLQSFIDIIKNSLLRIDEEIEIPLSYPYDIIIM